jgi:hypothetical protein
MIDSLNSEFGMRKSEIEQKTTVFEFGFRNVDWGGKVTN